MTEGSGDMEYTAEELKNVPDQVIFTFLQDAHLPFEYIRQKDGTCRADDDQSGIEAAEQQGYIKIVERGVPGGLHRFSGGPEPILNEGLQFVQPCASNAGEGSTLELKPFGDWKCKRCGEITHIPVVNGKVAEPFECGNDSCGRKGAFQELFPRDLIKPIWPVPLAPIETTGIEVYTAIYNFCKEYLVLKDEEYHLMTLWIMASWLVDDFQTCPYLCMIAPKSSGKSQALGVLGELSYRAVRTISVTAASLFRAIELWRITLLIDEAEYQVKQDSESGQALYGCLNGGYKKGSFAIRTEGESTCRMPVSFDVFGFKGIASTKLFHPTLESRSIIINMVQGMPQKVLIDTDAGAIIRAKLLFWRFETLRKLPIVLPESKIGRLIEMFIPLFTVAQVLQGAEGIKKPISYEDLLELLKNKIKEMEVQRKEEERDSVEAQILQAVLHLRDHPGERLLDGQDVLSIKDIASYLKTEKEWEEVPGREKVATTVGRRLKVMGLPTRHTNHGKIIEYLEERTGLRLSELEQRYIAVTDSDGK